MNMEGETSLALESRASMSAFDFEMQSMLQGARAALARVLATSVPSAHADAAASHDVLDASEQAALDACRTFFAEKRALVRKTKEERVRLWEQQAVALDGLFEDVPAVASRTRCAVDACATRIDPCGVDRAWYAHILRAVEDRDATALRIASGVFRWMRTSSFPRLMTSSQSEVDSRSGSRSGSQSDALLTAKTRLQSWSESHLYADGLQFLLLSVEKEEERTMQVAEELCEAAEARAVLWESCGDDIRSIVGDGYIHTAGLQAPSQHALQMLLHGPQSVSCALKPIHRYTCDGLHFYGKVEYPDSDTTDSVKDNGVRRRAVPVLCCVQFGYTAASIRYVRGDVYL
jgi:hypothetical protein